MTARIGGPKTGGRVKGSLDKTARQLVTSEMAHDILSVYKKLGGAKFLLSWAEENKTEFVRQALSRLMPAAAKDDADFVQNNQFNFDNLGTVEAARRVAFALALGVNAQQELEPAIEAEIVPDGITPQQACDWREPVGQVPSPEPVEDPAKAEWAASLPLTPEARQDQKLIRETQTANIQNYAGSGSEQGLGPVQRQSVERDPRAAQRDRMARRRKDLL